MIVDNELMALQARLASDPDLKNDPEVRKKVAAELESLFINELLKVVRESGGSSLMMGGGFGGDVYGSMFDTVISRKIAERGMGIGDMIVRSVLDSISEGGSGADRGGGANKMTDHGE